MTIQVNPVSFLEKKSLEVTDMIFVEPLEEIAKTCYQSVFIKDEIPLSLVFIADTDHGKSNLIIDYIPSGAAVRTELVTDISAMGIYKLIKDRTEPVTLIIPDFHAVISHRAAVSEGTITALLSVLQEGAMKISVGPGDSVELKGKRANLITALTPGILKQKSGKWRKLGFLRRLLPVHYAYNDVTAAKIHEYIRLGKYRTHRKLFDLPVKTPQVVLIPKPIDQEIERLAVFVSANLENRGFTCHKFFRVYVQSRALLKKRNTVTEQDFKDLESLSGFMNLEHPKQI